MIDRSSGDRAFEIERKFLVRLSEEDVSTYPFDEIEQGYLDSSGSGVSVRVRRRNEDYFLTVKHGSTFKRIEVEAPISRVQFEALWTLTEGRRLEKRRYYVPYEGFTVEVDVFHGDLEGLIMAEVEFDDEETARAFIPPSWLDPDVTADRRFTNHNLAIYGLPVSY